MAGLLDGWNIGGGLLGNAEGVGINPSQSGLLNFGLALMQARQGEGFSGALGRAGQAGLQGYSQGKQQQLQDQYQTERAGLLGAQRAKLEQDQALKARQDSYLSGLGQPIGMTGAPTVANAAPRAFDPFQAITQGGLTPDMAKSLAESQNWGKSKAGNFTNVAGPDGKPTIMAFDEFARPVATGQTPFEKSQFQNLGGRTAVLDPLTGMERTSLLNSQSPDALLSSQTTMRGQNMTDSRAREQATLTRQGLGQVFAPIPTSTGYIIADKQGNVREVTGPNGSPYMPVGIDADAQGRVSRSKAQGAAEGTAGAEAVTGLGKAEADAQNALNTINLAINHPGKKYAVGAASLLPTIPGTAQADFVSVDNQLKGQTFLQAFQSLKGGGAITEVEGQRATQAIARLDRAQSPQAYDAALKELSGIVSQGMERARGRATAGAAQSPSAAPTAPPRVTQQEADSLLNKYGIK